MWGFNLRESVEVQSGLTGEKHLIKGFNFPRNKKAHACVCVLGGGGDGV